MSLKLSSITNFSGFAAESAEWKRVGKIVFLVVGVPLFVMFLFCEYVGWNLGEDISPEAAAKLQQADPHLLWSGSSFASHYRFKLARYEQEKPDIMAIGESRVGSFRGAMFQPYSYYNIFRPSWPFSAYTEMLRRIPKEDSPKVIIFTLDFFMFNQDYSKYYYRESSPDAEKITLRDHVNMIRKCFLAIARNPLVLFASPRQSIRDVPALGLFPNVLGEGYRFDGSETPRVNHQPSDLLKTVRWDKDPSFMYCDAMQPEELASLEEFAKEARARGITLIGVQVPFYGPVIRTMETDSRFGILQDFRKHITDGYFDRLGILALDYSNLPPYADDPRYFVDAVHPTEVVIGAVVLKMAADPRVMALLPKLDTGDLQKKVDEAQQKSEFESLYHD